MLIPTIGYIAWFMIGLIFLTIVIKGQGGLTNMLAGGIGDCREKDLMLYGQEEPLEKILISRQIEVEAEFQKSVGFSAFILTGYFLLLVVAYGLLGPASFFGLFSIPAGSRVGKLTF